MKDIRKISEEELSSFIEELGEKRFRVKQIQEWLWKKGVNSFEKMQNLSLTLRENLVRTYTFSVTSILQKVQSKDGTMKFVFGFADRAIVEGVLIPTEKRVTACISSQAGCPLQCKFCATGQNGFERDLHFSEIYDQLFLMNEEAKIVYNKEISNVVLMGMGEPLLNYENVKQAILLVTTPVGLNWSPSRIILSTVGITDKIRQLADELPKIGLAVSLHSADNFKRTQLMPITKKYSLNDLREAIRYYVEKTKQRISIEYLLLAGINDSIQDADKLLQFCKLFPVKINLIEYNPTDLYFRKSSKEKTATFISYLEEKNLIVTLRQSRGQDIDAACGQLARRAK